MKRAARAEAGTPELGAALRSPGRPLESRLRARLEATLALRAEGGLRDVRVHTDADADAAARALDAEAVTVGRHILFRSGRFAPETPEGWLLVVHEAAHAHQQRHGPEPERIADAPPLDVAHPSEQAADAPLPDGEALPAPAAPALRRTSERIDPARIVDDIAAALVQRFRDDPGDTGGRIRQQLIAMEARLRRDVLRSVERGVGDEGWRRFLATISEPLPPGLEGSSDGATGEAIDSPPDSAEDAAAKPEAPETETKAPEEASADPATEPQAAVEEEPADAEPEASGENESTAPATLRPAPEPADGVAAPPDQPADTAATATGGMAAAPSGGTPAMDMPEASPAEEQEAAVPEAQPTEPDEREAEAEEEGESTEAAPQDRETPQDRGIAEDGAPEAEPAAPDAAPVNEQETGDNDPEPASSEPESATEEPPAAGAETLPDDEAPAGEAETDDGGEAPSTSGPPPAMLGEFAGDPPDDADEAAPTAGGGGAASQAPEPEAEEPAAEGTADEQLGAAATMRVATIRKVIGSARAAASAETQAEAQALAAAPPSLDRAAVAARPERAEAPSPGPARTIEPIAGTVPAAVDAAPSGPAPSTAPPVALEVPRVAGNGDGTIGEADAGRVRDAVAAVAVTDPALQRSIGPAPVLALDGASDPAAITARHGALEIDIAAQQQAGTAARATPFGEDAIRAAAPAATLVAASAPIAQALPAAEAGPAPAREEALIAEDQRGDAVRSAAGDGAGRVATARAERESRRADAEAAHAAEVDTAIAGDTEAQRVERERARAEVGTRRAAWTQAEAEPIAAARRDGDTAARTAGDDIAARAGTGREEARRHVEEGDREIDGVRTQAEGDARTRRDQARREADGGVLGWIASAIASFFARLRDDLHRLFDAARAAVGRAIAKAQQLVADAIARARDAVAGLIRRAGEALLAVVDRLFVALPGVRDRFRALIRAAVDGAVAAVERLAGLLTRGLQALLDGIGRVLNGLLSAYEAIYGAIIDVVASAVNGALAFARSVVAGFGAFAALIADIAPDPGGWISKLGAAVVDGIRNHLWAALKTAVKRWFNEKVEAVVGVGKMLLGLLRRGGLTLAKIGRFVWKAIISALPMIIVQFLVQRLIAMIVPAAGALMLVIQGIMAAWGAIQQVMSALSAVWTFLRAVKGGQAGPQFAAALAASAITLIEFLAQFLLARIGSAAGGVATKLKALAGRLMAFFKRVGSAIGRGIKRVAGAVRRGLKRIGGALRRGARAVGRGLRRVGRALGRTGLGRGFRKARARFGRWRSRRRAKRGKTPKESGADRLQRALRSIRPSLTRMLERGVSPIRLRLMLAAWRLRWRLRKLQLDGDRIIAGNSPDIDVMEALGKVDAVELGRRLEAVIRQAEAEMLPDLEARAGVGAQQRLAAARRLIGAGNARGESPRGLPDILQYRLFRDIVTGVQGTKPLSRGGGRFYSAIVRAGGPTFTTYVNRRVNNRAAMKAASLSSAAKVAPIFDRQTGSGLYVAGAGDYPLVGLGSPGREGLVHIIEPARMAGQRGTEQLSDFLRDSKMAPEGKITGANAPFGPMTAQGSSRAADIDEGRMSPSPAGSDERAQDDAARAHRHTAIRNIFARLVAAVDSGTKSKAYRTLPSAQQAALDRLVAAFTSWFDHNFRVAADRIVPDGRTILPAGAEAAELAFRAALQAFLGTL